MKADAAENLRQQDHGGRAATSKYQSTVIRDFSNMLTFIAV